jgi:hypothetical protein
MIPCSRAFVITGSGVRIPQPAPHAFDLLHGATQASCRWQISASIVISGCAAPPGRRCGRVRRVELFDRILDCETAVAPSQENVIMKATLAMIVLGALVLMTSGANAYRSNANGYQSYSNPDRETYVNRSCCSWKTTHAKARHAPIKH